MDADGLIPREEIARRREELLFKLAEANIEVAIFTSAPNVHYLTGIEFGGFATRHALLVRLDGASALVVREIEHAWSAVPAYQAAVDEWIFYPDQGEWHTTLVEAVRGQLTRPGRLGAETSRPSLAHDEAGALLGLPDVTELIDVAPLIEEVRAVKSELEVELMRRCARLTGEGTRAAWAEVGSGATDHEAMLAAMRVMYEGGSELISDGPFVVTGPGSALAHARASSRRAVYGDLASTMMSASIGRYQCPSERSFVVGGADEQLMDILHLVAEATTHVTQRLGPGISSAEADRLARDFWRARQRGSNFTHRLGYSIGVAYPPLWWENDVMQLRPGDGRLTMPGMTFHLVPGIHVEGLGFVNQSMPVVITDDGCEPLSDLELVMDPA